MIVSYLRPLIAIIIVLFVGFSPLMAQDDPFKIDYYNFIHYNKNKLEYHGDSSQFYGLFQKINKLVLYGDRQINVVHIGGSHIQAGALPGHISERLNNITPGLKGGRGFVFPYSISKTNVPRNYKIKYEGSWEYCRSVNRKKTCTLGLSGIMVKTSDSKASISVIIKKTNHLPHYDFNRLKIFHDISPSAFEINLGDSTLVDSYIVNEELGYTEFFLKKHADTLNLRFKKTTEEQNSFTLYGISLDNDDPGFVYHGIGVNGASIPAYLRCQLFDNHLEAVNPDWVILTLGTNDAYTRKFVQKTFEANYDSLLNHIRKVAPNAAILMTVPNDSYISRRYLNPNTAKVRETIRKLAKRHSAAVWDFYGVMGELNSITLWYEAGLTSIDKIHFNRKGYFLQADLMFNAFLSAYNRYIDTTNNSNETARVE